MGIAAILVMWPGPFEQISFPHPREAPYGIWLWLAQWFQKRRCLKSVDYRRGTDEGQTTDGRWTTEDYLSYKLTKWAFGSGELKIELFENLPLILKIFIATVSKWQQVQWKVKTYMAISFKMHNLGWFSMQSYPSCTLPVSVYKLKNFDKMILFETRTLIIVQIKTPNSRGILFVCKISVFGNEELHTFIEMWKLMLTFIQAIDTELRQISMKTETECILL